MKSIFGTDAIFSFLDSLKSLLEKHKEYLKDQLQDLDNYDKIQEQLAGWRTKSSSDIQALYDNLQPQSGLSKEVKDLKDSKPDYDVFMQTITEEFMEDTAFKEKMSLLGEEISDLKEFIMSKIQDDISIYSGQQGI